MAVEFVPNPNVIGPTGPTGPTGAVGDAPLTTKGDLFTHNGSADARLPVASSDTYVLQSNSTTSTGLEWVAGGTRILDTQTFTSSTTYTVSSAAKMILIECVSAGGGGASGASSTSSRCGGQGGAGGCFFRIIALASDFSGSQTVTIGAGGAGGPATNNASSGTTGSAGGVSRFGKFFFAPGVAGRFGSNANQTSGFSFGYQPEGVSYLGRVDESGTTDQFRFAAFGKGGEGNATSAGTAGNYGLRGCLLYTSDAADE